jgi:hypothetical protein
VIIEGVRRTLPPSTTIPRNAAGRFAVPIAADQPLTPAPTAAASPLEGVLALQEQAADLTRDRQARQHGQALLQALAALQHAMLAGAAQTESLQRLATLTAACPSAMDPALATIIQGLSLRAQVELARRGL